MRIGRVDVGKYMMAVFVTGGKTGAKTAGAILLDKSLEIGMQAIGIETTGAVLLDVSLAVGVQTIGAVLLEVHLIVAAGKPRLSTTILSIKSGVVKTTDVTGTGQIRIMGPHSRREVRRQVVCLGLIHIMVPRLRRGKLGTQIPSTERPKGP